MTDYAPISSAYDQRDSAAASAASPAVIVGGAVWSGPSDAQRRINPERAAATFPALGGG